MCTVVRLFPSAFHASEFHKRPVTKYFSVNITIRVKIILGKCNGASEGCQFNLMRSTVVCHVHINGLSVDKGRRVLFVVE